MPRVGRKRSDRRWKAADGTIWASKFEYEVYRGLKDAGYVVRKCEKGTGDTFNYQSPVKSGKCLSCGSHDVVQERTYTPDICVLGKGKREYRRPYYIEAKGHFPGSKRNLLRSFLKTGPSIDLRLIIQNDSKATSTRSLGEYIDYYLKLPWHRWNPQLKEPGPVVPDEWNEQKTTTKG